MRNSKYPCRECGGSGETHCGACDESHECRACEGECVDWTRIDKSSFYRAVENAKETQGSAGGSCDAMEGRVCVGRRGLDSVHNTTWVVRLDDHLITKEPTP